MQSFMDRKVELLQFQIDMFSSLFLLSYVLGLTSIPFLPKQMLIYVQAKTSIVLIFSKCTVKLSSKLLAPWKNCILDICALSISKTFISFLF